MLSLCMIAKDAHADIGRAINSVRDVAEEIVVVDTGSADGTPELASSLGARVTRLRWQEDFSAARNVAHSIATGDWILWLDSDEVLLPESRDSVRSCMARPELAGVYVVREDLTTESPVEYSEMLLLRLFRRLPGLKLVGRCHEHFEPALEETAIASGMMVESSGIRIRHWGYLGPRQMAKAERNARLLEMELHDRPKQTYFMVELARTLASMGDHRAHTIFCEAAEKALGDWRANRPRRPEYILVLEWIFQQRHEFPPERSLEDSDAAAEAWFPDCVPLLWYRSEKYFTQRRFEQAAQLLERLCQLAVDGSYDRTIAFSPDLLGDRTRLNLAGCYVRMGQLDQARQLYGQLLRSSLCSHQARQNLEAIVGL